MFQTNCVKLLTLLMCHLNWPSGEHSVLSVVFVCSLQICIAFQLFRGMSVIPKTVTKERVHQNLAATKVKLSDEDMAKLYAINKNLRYLRQFMVKAGQSLDEYWDVERDAKFMA